MASRLWLNLLLVLAALALLWFLQRPPTEPTHVPRLTQIDPASIQNIRLLRAGEETILLRREGEGWQLLAPRPLPANGVRIESLLKIPQQPYYGNFPAGELDLRSIGLQPSRVTLELDDLRLEFGDTDPLSHRRYVRIGDSVYLIEDKNFYSLAAKLSGFISLRLLRPDDELISVDLPGTKLSRRGQGWHIEGEQTAKSGDDPQRLAQTWQSASALEVEVAEQLDQKGHERITLGRRDKPPLRLVIIRRRPDLILWRPDLGLRYRFTEHQAKQMLQLSPDQD